MWGSDTSSRWLSFPGTTETHLALFVLQIIPPLCLPTGASLPSTMIYLVRKMQRDSSQALGFIYVCPWKANTWKLNFAFLHFYLFKMKCPYQKQYNQPNDWRIRSYVSLAPWPWIDHIVQTCLVKFDERFMEGFFRTPLGRNFHCAKVPQSA